MHFVKIGIFAKIGDWPKLEFCKNWRLTKIVGWLKLALGQNWDLTKIGIQPKFVFLSIIAFCQKLHFAKIGVWPKLAIFYNLGSAKTKYIYIYFDML